MQRGGEMMVHEAVVQKGSGWVRRGLRAVMRFAKRFYPSVLTLRRVNYHGFSLHVWANEHIGQRILISGRFEEDEMARFLQFVQEGDTCVDVGANIGTHTLNLARAVGRGRVVAFEPVRRNSLLVELNCELNGLRNVTVVPRPLAERSGISLSPQVLEGDSACGFFKEGADGEPSITLDDYCADTGISEIDFLKIDVEGAELSILRGSKRMLTANRHPRCVVVEVVAEYLDRFGDTVSNLIGFMQGLDYRPYVVREGMLIPATDQRISAENVYFRSVS